MDLPGRAGYKPDPALFPLQPDDADDDEEAFPFLVPAEESRQKQLAAGVATRSYADCLKGPSVTGDREEFVKLPSTQIDSDGIPFVEWEEESLLLANSRYRFSLIARFAVVGGLLSRRLESGAPRHGA